MGWVQINELWEAIKGLRDSTNSKESLDTSSLDADTPLDADLLSFWDVVDLERKKITCTNFKTLLGLTFEPLLPATPADPSNKFLDGNKAWSAITGFQETLVSGTNIKTINSTSLLGSGDIVISGGGEHEYDVDSVDSNTKYIGIADKGTATSATGWTVTKLVISNVGAVTETHATGIYDDRETLIYA